MAVARDRLVPLKIMPTGNPTRLANAAIEIPPVITVDVIRLCLRYLWLYWIILFYFFFWQFVHELQFRQEKMPQFRTICSSNMPVILMLLKGLNLDKIWFHCHICSSLFNNWRKNVLRITSLLFSSSILKSRWGIWVSNSKNTRFMGEKVGL